MFTKENLLKIKSEFNVEYVFNIVVSLIIAIIIILSCLAMYRPINTLQYQEVRALAQQELYPKTQAMAVELTHKEVIRSSDYYRLIYAKHFESSKVKVYPAASLEGQ